MKSAQVDDHVAGRDETLPAFNLETDALLKGIPTPYQMRIGRKAFCKLISKGIDVRYGKRLTRVESDGKITTASFEDGSTETGDLIIGCEGAHSVVRDYLLPDKSSLTSVPVVASFAMAKLPAEAAEMFKTFTHNAFINFHPLGYCGWIGCK